MKICILSELFHPYDLGGAERRFIEIAKRMSMKHEVTVYSLRLFNQPSKEKWHNMEIIRVGLPHPMNRRSLTQMLSYKTPFLRSMMSKYDIVHANQGMASFAGLFSGVRKPVIATFHDIFWRDWPKYFRFPFSYAGKFFELSWSKMKYDRIIANSDQTKRKLEELGFRSPINVIYSGVDTKYIKSVKPVKSDGVVYVGRLVGYKNIEMLIHIFNKLGSELKIIGSGPDEERLKKMAKPNIKFLGYVSEEEKIAHIKGAKLLINPSTTEGLGLILLEAMACGTPVMARELECYREFCDKENSVLTTITAEKVKSLLDNREKMKKIRISGIKTAKKFDWDNIAEKVEKVYEASLSEVWI